MLQVARLAPGQLGESSPLVAAYVLGQQTERGGFADRAGAADLYYTVFGVECLAALQQPLPTDRLAAYLRGFGDGAALDLVHFCCLVRCWAALGQPLALPGRLESEREADGGFGTLYRTFMAHAAYQDMDLEPPVETPVERFRAGDGGYADFPGAPSGLVPSTAAAVALRRALGLPPDPALADWLVARCHPRGGFFATPVAPIPDLLSTATALHALTLLRFDLAPLREVCLDFVDTLWSSRGAFCGSWADDTFDVEYTWYALLALGHLSL